MKILNRNKHSVERFLIDYENDVECSVELVNDKLSKYIFRNSDESILYLIEDIQIFKETHWSSHHKLFKDTKNLKLKDLENFTEFDKLYIMGGSKDGTMRDRFGNTISSLQILDDIHCKIYHKINTLKKSNQFKEFADQFDWVKKCEVVEIPYYNREEDDGDTHSVRFEVLLPDDLNDEMYKVTKSGYFNDDCKSYIINYIMKTGKRNKKIEDVIQ